MSGETHGKRSTYGRGCRCDSCIEGAQRHRRRGIPEGDSRHGTVNGYRNLGCHCQLCRSANADSLREWRARRVESGSGVRDPVTRPSTLIP